MPKFFPFLAALGAFTWLIPTPAAHSSPVPSMLAAPFIEERVVARRMDSGGQVLAVSPTSLTLRTWESDRRHFGVADDLARGKVGSGYRHKYDMADVKIGDIVQVSYDQLTTRAVCTAITILRRYGGRVPPAHEPPDRICKFHEGMNAAQELEEKGLVPPRFFRPPEQ